MSPFLTEKLASKYPQIFRDLGGDPQKTCMAFGIECGDGWHGIIDRCCAKIMEAGVDSDFKAQQIKEKFGGLRFYVSSSSSEVDKIISAAEALSVITCEYCGEPGEQRARMGWVRTLCSVCRGED